MRKKKTTLHITNEFRQGVGTICLTIFSLVFLFLVVTQVTTETIQLTIGSIIGYSVLDALFFVVGCILLNSIKHPERDKVRYIAGESSRYVAVRIDGERPPRTEQPVPPTKKTKKSKKQK